MALVYTSAGTANAASGASPTTIATTTAFAVGDVLVVAMAYDNSGGGGADPLSSFVVGTGGTATNVSAQTGLNDPGAASAGLAARCNAYTITQAVSSGANITISWSGTVVVRAFAMVKVSSNAGGTVSYRTNSGATGANTVAGATPALTTPSVTNGELVLCWAGCEWGINLTGDADTTNGSWGSIVTTFNGSTTSGISIGVQGKTVTATATQAFNPTNGGNVTDWILGALIFTEVVPVPPTARTISGSQSGPDITITFAADTGASPTPLYDLYISTDGSSFSVLDSNRPGSPLNVNLGAMANTTVWFYVIGKNSAGTAQSNTIGSYIYVPSKPKVYISGAFSKRPLKVWSGTAWNEKPIKVWTGSVWKTLT